MKIQPTCQPQPWRAVRESPPHKKHGVFTQKAWGWDPRRYSSDIHGLEWEEKHRVCSQGAFQPSGRGHMAGASLSHSPGVKPLFLLGFFFFFAFRGLKESNDLWTNSPATPNETRREFLNDLKWHDTFSIVSKSTVFELKYALCLLLQGWVRRGPLGTRTHTCVSAHSQSFSMHCNMAACWKENKKNEQSKI